MCLQLLQKHDTQCKYSRPHERALGWSLVPLRSPVEHAQSPTPCPESLRPLQETPPFGASGLPWQQTPSGLSSETFSHQYRWTCHHSHIQQNLCHVISRRIMRHQSSNWQMFYLVLHPERLEEFYRLYCVALCYRWGYLSSYISTNMVLQWVTSANCYSWSDSTTTGQPYLSNQQACDWTCFLFTLFSQISLHGLFYYIAAPHPARGRNEMEGW